MVDRGGGGTAGLQPRIVPPSVANKNFAAIFSDQGAAHGAGTLGVFNALAVVWDAKKGYVGPLAHGSSFIQTVAFDGDGCPDARTILTYSQSTNPTSEHFSDQTALFSRSGWVTDRFCDGDVAAGTLRTERLRG